MIFGHTEKTIGNKYGEASCVRNTANNYDNIGATKSTIMSVAKKPVNIYSGLYGISKRRAIFTVNNCGSSCTAQNCAFIFSNVGVNKCENFWHSAYFTVFIFSLFCET